MAADDTAHEPRLTPTADLARRVGALEGQMAGVVADLADVKVAQAVMANNQSNLANTVVTQHGQAMQAIGALGVDFKNAMEAGYKASAEMSATPAGRAVLALIADRDRRDDEHRKETDADVAEAKSLANKALTWTIRAGGAAAALLAVLILFAPAVRHALGIPG